MSLNYMFVFGLITASLYICSLVGATTFHSFKSDSNERAQITRTTGNNNNNNNSNGFRGGGRGGSGALLSTPTSNGSLRSISYTHLPPIDQTNLKSIYRSNFLFPLTTTATIKKSVTTKQPARNQSFVLTNNNTKRIKRNEDLFNRSLSRQNKEEKSIFINDNNNNNNNFNSSDIETNNDINLANRSDSNSINLLVKTDLPNTLSALPISNNVDNNIIIVQNEQQQQQTKATSPSSPNDSIVIFDNEIINNDDNDINTIKDETDKIMETHVNNHNALTNNGANGGNSRHYNTYQSHQHQHHNYINNNHNKYLFNSNSFGNNINLNYIHSLLTNSKPLLSGAAQSLSSMLNSYPIQAVAGSLTGGGSSFSSMSTANNYHPIGITNYNSVSQSLNQHKNQHQQPTTVVSFEQAHTTQQQQQQQQEQQSNETNFSDLFGPSIQQCGKQQVGYREPRIVGGNNTYEGEFPWAVSIQRHGNHHCGGVIVGKRWILTAAHCVRSQLVGNLLVRTGGHTLSRNSNSINSHLERDYFVDQIVMHGDFSRHDNSSSSTQMKSSNADIALLRLSNNILWNEFAWPVCFPHREAGNFSGFDAVVIGWGKLNEKSEDFSNELQKVKLTIIDNKVCQNWFRQAGREMPIDDSIICAGFKNGGKDACHGDSGGPLLSKINGHYVVVGVVSTGIGCARPLLPGLYSRVSSYISWIERYISKDSFNLANTNTNTH